MRGGGDAPALLDCYRGRRVVILGTADCAWRDLEEYRKIDPRDHDIMAVNEIGAFVYGALEHWVTLHPDLMEPFLYYRIHAMSGAHHTHFHAHKDISGNGMVEAIWNVSNLGATSSGFAAMVALALGYEPPIVLCGVPLQGHYFFGGDFPCAHAKDDAQRLVWTQIQHEVFKGRVKSMSGRTREWLGGPFDE